MEKSYRNKIDYRLNPDAGEVNDEPSLTEPDQANTIAEIMQKAARGEMIKQRRYQYLDVDDVALVDKYFSPGALDFTDLDKLTDRINEINNLVDEVKAKAEKEKAEQVAADTTTKETTTTETQTTA